MTNINIEFENGKEIKTYFTACTQIEDIAVIDLKETGNHISKDIFNDNFIDSENDNIIYSHIDEFLNELRSQLKNIIDLKIEDEFMKISYQKWKNNKEEEMEKWRNDNYRIIYPYQDGYKKYLKSPEWIMYGDFCFFIRKSKKDEPEKINEKYNYILLINDNVFEGFCTNEMKRIHTIQECMDGYENGLEYAKNIFKYSGIGLKYQELDDKHKKIFKKCFDEFLINNTYELGIYRKYEDMNEELEEKLKEIPDEVSYTEEELKEIEKEMEEDLRKVKENVKEFVKEWRRLCKKYDMFDEEGKTLDELVDMWMDKHYELYFMEDHYDMIEDTGGKEYAQYYCYNVGICPAEEVEIWNK